MAINNVLDRYMTARPTAITYVGEWAATLLLPNNYQVAITRSPDSGFDAEARNVNQLDRIYSKHSGLNPARLGLFVDDIARLKSVDAKTLDVDLDVALGTECTRVERSVVRSEIDQIHGVISLEFVTYDGPELVNKQAVSLKYTNAIKLSAMLEAQLRSLDTELYVASHVKPKDKLPEWYIDQTEFYWITDNTIRCCDDTVMVHVCKSCNETMGCYYCEFDYNVKHDCKEDES